MKYKPHGFALLCFLLYACPTVHSQTDATSRNLERTESAEVFAAQENYAVIVGVDAYDLATPLNYAVADARRLATFFESQNYVVELLLNNDATPSRILRRLRDVGTVATNGGSREQGNLVFAFSGHGFREGGVNYLATGETNPEQITGTALSLSDVQKTLRETGVRQRVLFIDACRNDPAKGSSYTNGTFVPDEAAEGEAILYSTRSGTLSWEDPGLGHGVFTHYLVRGMEGAATGEDGLVTFNDLQRYVVGEVKRHVLQQFKKTQIPYIGGERTGEFVVAKYANDTARTARLVVADVVALEQRLRLTREEKQNVQRALNRSGFPVGTEDGIWGRGTRNGIKSWQEQMGFAGTGYLDETSYKELVAELVLPDVVVPDVPQRRSFEPEMVRIQGGSFMMGSTDGDDDEKPVHRVNVENFELGRYEVTVSQWRAYIESSGYRTEAERDVGGAGCRTWSGRKWGWTEGTSWRDLGFSQTEGNPVVCVSWNDVQSYVEWLNANTTGGYRLPSESEWEYALRAGSEGKFHFGNDERQLCAYANGGDRSTVSEMSWSNTDCSDGHERTAPVGSLEANGNGLYDMHGNVWEWTEDCWHASYEGAPDNGSAWTQGGECGRRVVRGGSWGNGPENLRSAGRNWSDKSFRSVNAGFRVSRTLTP